MSILGRDSCASGFGQKLKESWRISGSTKEQRSPKLIDVLKIKSVAWAARRGLRTGNQRVLASLERNSHRCSLDYGIIGIPKGFKLV